MVTFNVRSLNLLRRVDNFGKIPSACWQHDIRYTEWMTVNVLLYALIYLSTFPHIMCNKNKLMIGKIYKKRNSQARLGCSYFENIFT